MVKKIFANIYIYLILLLMYLPILVLIAFAFSTNDLINFDLSKFNFGWDLFKNLFDPNNTNGHAIWIAMGNTLIIAVTSAVCATLLGTLGAIGTFYCKKGTKKAIEVATQIPVVNAEIVIALSLALLFVFVGNLFKAEIFSFWTLLIGHVVLGIPFVYLSVKPKLQQMDPNLYEAALDLGATPSQGLTKVIVPQILPGILSGFLLSITLSLDDFIITEFTRGAGLLSGNASIETLSTFIQTNLKKHSVPAELRPLTLFIFLAVLLVVILVMVYQTSKKRKANKVVRIISYANRK